MGTASSFLSNFGLTYPVLLDEQREVYFSYPIGGISPYPRDFIIDQQGIIRYAHSEYDPQTMIDVIDGLLVSGLKDQDAIPQIPSDFGLKAYPNPFNPSTVIHYALPENSAVDVSVYNLLGQKVETLISEQQAAGSHQVQWNAAGFSAGVYFVQLTAGGISDTEKIVLVR